MLYYGHGRDIEPLRIRAMVSSNSAITPATGGIITISTDVASGWLEFIELVPTLTGSASINYVQPWQFRKQAGLIQSTTSPQYIYTIEGDYLYLAPAAVGTVAAKWYQKFAAVSLDADTDWIITNAPQVYLDGCLMLACAYTSDEREPVFRGKFAAGIKALNMNDQRQRMSGSVPVARPRSVV